MDEDNFKLRVNKIFGSLSSSSSSSSSITTTSNLSSSLWSLTDDEIEKREWNRPKQDSPEPESTPYPSNLDGFFSNQRQKQPRMMSEEDKSLKFTSEIEEDLDDLDDEEEVTDDASKLADKPEDHDDEEWQIRSSIGLDCTLDFEEEEDEYDKLAAGAEKAGDRVYMREVSEYERIRNTHMTATLELKEITEATENVDSVMGSDETQRAGDVIAQTDTNKDSGNLKSILKRKESNSDTKMQKRVHFDPECKNDFQEEYENAKENSLMEDRNPAVPDYLLNPSKYTCYTFDSSNDIDEESNKKAYMDFLNLVRKPNTMEDLHVGLPKSVAFTPRKKIGDSTAVKKSSINCDQNEEDDCKDSTTKRKSLPVLITAADVQESEACAMDEDEPETVIENSKSSRKSGRQYRSKVSSELDHYP